MIYLVAKPHGEGFRKLYYSHGPHGLGTTWTFEIADAIWWKTTSGPRAIASWHSKQDIDIISMTNQEFFKRKLKGK